MNFRKWVCIFPLHPLCFVTVLFLVLVSNIPSLEADVEKERIEEDKERFEKCSQTFDCGTFKDLSFPFWGDGRPQYCGQEGYELICEELDGRPVIGINGQEFEVLKLHQSGQNMTLSRPSFSGNEPCPSTLNHALFQPLNGALVSMTLFRGCSNFNREPSRRISCSIDGQSISYLFLRDMEKDPQSCPDSVRVSVQKEALEELNSGVINLSDALRRQFDVQYVTNDAYCSRCQKSGGKCGSNQILSSKFACYCQYGSYDKECRDSLPVIAVVTIGAIFLALVVGLVLRMKRVSIRRLGIFMMANGYDSNIEAFIKNYASVAPKRYNYSDIKKMTNSYKEKLGQGGYGDVFKGNLHDGQSVAVKVLNASKGNGEDFVNEVVSISRTSHINIVTLVGFCLEGNKRALIYEFMPNGSLEKFIFKESSILGWEKLYHISLGIARGLEYLHRGCNTRILHLDIKPHNILLDEEFHPKISDFGLSKLCTRKDSIVSLLEARGTIGYIAPEVFSKNFGAVSHKSDVYSYGMMILEMVGGKKSDRTRVSISSEYFPDWIYRDLEATNELELQGLNFKVETDTKKKMILVALWCIQTIPSNRPSINKVIEMLEGSVEALPMPPKPFFSSPPRPIPESTASSSFDSVSLVE